MTNVPPGHLSCPDDAHLRSQVSSGETFFWKQRNHQSHREIPPKKNRVYIYIIYIYYLRIYLCANSNFSYNSKIPESLGEFWEIPLLHHHLGWLGWGRYNIYVYIKKTLLDWCLFTTFSWYPGWHRCLQSETTQDTPPKFNMEPENDGFQVRNLRISRDFFSGSIFPC